MIIAQTNSVKDQLLEFVTLHSAWMEPIVFALGLGESLIVVSFFIPSTFLFLAIGGLYAAADGVFWHIWLAGAGGAFVGDTVSYFIGRYFKKDIRQLRAMNTYQAVYAHTRLLCRQWGALAVITSKFMGMIRPIVPLAAGAMAMPLPKFLLASAFSCLIWAGAFLSPGFGFKWFMY